MSFLIKKISEDAKLLAKIAFIVVLLTAGAIYVQATWTNPPVNPPLENVPAPINVGEEDQSKLGFLGVDALAVFGDTLLSTNDSQAYLNFQTNGAVGVGEAGYGIRDNNGVIECKNIGDTDWGTCGTSDPNTTKILFCSAQLKFYAPDHVDADSDGCVGTTAASVPPCPSGQLPAPDTGVCGEVLDVYTFKQPSSGQCGANFANMDRCDSLNAASVSYLQNSCGYHSFSSRGTCIGGFNCPEDGLSAPDPTRGTCNGKTFSADPPNPVDRCVDNGRATDRDCL